MKTLRIAFFMLFTYSIGAINPTKVNFYQGKITQIKEAAMSSGKLYVLDFVAPWCTPCKLMEETTYNDEVLADFIHANYIFAKVNIDDLEGLALKQKYDVVYLPTILIFNQDGEIVGRHEQSMGGSKMLEVLSKYNTPENGAGKITPTNTAPTNKINVSPTAKFVANPSSPKISTTNPNRIDFEKSLGKKIEKPNINPNSKNKLNADGITNSTTANNSKQLQTMTNPNTALKTATYSIGMGLYRLDISRAVNKGFSIQAVVLSQYDNVIKFYEEAKLHHANQSILLLVENLNGKTVYKILVGEFKTKQEAENYSKEKLKDGYVKKL